MSTKDVDVQFIVARLLHEVSKRKECESSKTTALVNKTHKSNEKLCFYCKKPGHFVRSCLKKKNDEKEKVNQACENHEQMFVAALSAIVVAQARRDKNLYLLNVKVHKDMAHIANSPKESAMLWHERLGHLNMASLKELDAMVDGMNLKEVPLHHICEGCIKSKHQRTSFPKDGATKGLTTFGNCAH
jgi:hypothetical protein